MKSSSLTSQPSMEGPLPVSRQLGGLLAWLGVTFVAAAVGGIASMHAGEFYERLARPDWAPPAWIFGPVWGLLYLLMGVAAWLVWKAGGFEHSGGALPLFVVQLGANALWTWLFFAWRLGAWSFAEMLLLWCLIAATLVLFWRVRKLAGLLLLPYLAWVTFAVVLCHAIWRLNPGVLGAL